MTTWKKQIERVLNGDEIIYCTLSEEELNKEFDNGYGGTEGKPFTSGRIIYMDNIINVLEDNIAEIISKTNLFPLSEESL